MNDCDWIGGGSENYANINNYDKSKLEGRGRRGRRKTYLHGRESIKCRLPALVVSVTFIAQLGHEVHHL